MQQGLVTLTHAGAGAVGCEVQLESGDGRLGLGRVVAQSHQTQPGIEVRRRWGGWVFAPQAKARCGQAPPRKQRAGIGFAAWRHIGMANEVGSWNAVAGLDVGQQASICASANGSLPLLSSSMPIEAELMSVCPPHQEAPACQAR